jgi:hypothetical protein
MKTGERRAITAGEIAFSRVLFGDEIEWARVRVAQAPPFGFGAMVPLGRTIVFAKWRAARDFAGTALGEQGWFVHELMHVWQASQDVVLAGAKLGALGKSAYAYKPRANAKFAHFNIESQAEIARHLFLARSGAREEGMPSADWLEAVWATRFKARSPGA